MIFYFIDMLSNTDNNIILDTAPSLLSSGNCKGTNVSEKLVKRDGADDEIN